MQPIETEYNCRLYRSRTEARWALFFDLMNVEFVYEEEGYDLGDLRYLPDFWLPPPLNAWLEVKGRWPVAIERRKGQELSDQSRTYLAIAVGDPMNNNLIVTPHWDKTRFMPCLRIKETEDKTILYASIGLMNIHITERDVIPDLIPRFKDAQARARRDRFDWP